jgi:hypothetical protein
MNKVFLNFHDVVLISAIAVIFLAFTQPLFDRVDNKAGNTNGSGEESPNSGF